MADINFFGSVKQRSAKNRLAQLQQSLGNAHADSFDDYGFDYFDNPKLGCGYGGYFYDGRYAEVAAKITQHYRLKPGDRVLEIGCAKGYLLVEFEKLGLEVCGVEFSAYAIQQAHPAVRNKLVRGSAACLPLQSQSMDLLVSKEMLPHLEEHDINLSFSEFNRVAKANNILIEIQCARSREAQNLCVQWDRTHRTIKPPQWWRQKMQDLSYQGDFHLKELFNSPLTNE